MSLKARWKDIAKKGLRRLAPGGAGRWLAARERVHNRRFEERMGLPQIAQAFTARHGRVVLGGPFAGMTYVPHAVGSTFVPKLLGSYEEELHPLIARMPHKGYDTVVDVGCAEGYYAVGLARLLPTAQVYAFDTDPAGRNLCAEMAAANDVTHRVTVDGYCDPARLGGLLAAAVPSGCVLVVCDCEGYEHALLRPDLVPGLASADILVETHEDINPAIPAAVSERFAATHDIHWVASAARDPARYPALGFLEAEKQSLAVCEFRSVGQRWAFLTARTVEDGA